VSETDETLETCAYRRHSNICKSDLLLKQTVLATYKRRQMKHLKYVFKTLSKKHLKTIVKHTQHPDKTLATYV
jgi:hypothetical protein